MSSEPIASSCAASPGFSVSPSSRAEADVLSFPSHQPPLRHRCIAKSPAVWLPARASSETGDVDTGSGRCHLGPATLALIQAGRRAQHLDNCTTSTASSIPPNGPSRLAAVEARHSRSHTDISCSRCVCREETVSCETSCPNLHPANTPTRISAVSPFMPIVIHCVPEHRGPASCVRCSSCGLSPAAT